eukprot:SAG11_NODE_11510_length_756_cov_0.837139_1_plen_91_part_10
MASVDVDGAHTAVHMHHMTCLCFKQLLVTIQQKSMGKRWRVPTRRRKRGQGKKGEGRGGAGKELKKTAPVEGMNRGTFFLPLPPGMADFAF